MPWSICITQQSDRIKFGWDSFWGHLLRHILTKGQSLSAVSPCFSGELVGLQFSLLLLIKRKCFLQECHWAWFSPHSLSNEVSSFGEKNETLLSYGLLLSLDKISEPLLWVLGGAVASGLLGLFLTVLFFQSYEWAGITKIGALVSGLAIPGVKPSSHELNERREPSAFQPHSSEFSHLSLESDGLRKAGGLPFRWDEIW